MSIAPPGWTMVPNSLLDYMAQMSDVELRVSLAIVRKTIGYHKDGPEPVSYTQLQKLTGLSRQGVKNGLDRSIERGVVKKTTEGGHRNVNRFTLDVAEPPVEEPDQSTQLTSPKLTSLHCRPELVNTVDTQKKCTKEKNPTGAKKTAPDGTDKSPRARSKKQQALDAMKNAIADAFGLDHDKVTATQWNEFGKAGAELILAGAKPEDMKLLYQWCVAQKWKGRFTSLAMAKNWANYAKDRDRQEQTSDSSAGLRRETAASAAERAMYGERAS